jgi:hypothetical protein
VTASETPASPSAQPRTGVSPAKTDEASRTDELLRTRFMLDWEEYQEGYGRRRFLYISSIAASLAGVTFFVWPFLESMNPAADVEATATTEVDLSKIKPGESVTVVWRGQPCSSGIGRRPRSRPLAATTPPRCQIRNPTRRGWSGRNGSM